MKQTIIDSKYTIHDEVWIVRGNGIPRRTKVEGLWIMFDHRDDENKLMYIVDGWEKHEFELFDSLEELAKKQRFTSPHQAKILLERDKKREKSWFNAEEIAFLEKRILDYNALKATKKK